MELRKYKKIKVNLWKSIINYLDIKTVIQSKNLNKFFKNLIDLDKETISLIKILSIISP